METFMKTVIALLLAASMAACMPAEEPADLSAESRAELDAELAGRSAGPDTSCIPVRDIRHTRTVGDGVMLFEGRGDVVWTNRAPGGCPVLRHGRAFRTSTTISQLCRGDIVTVFDPVSGAEFAGCSLGDFTPHRRTF